MYAKVAIVYNSQVKANAIDWPLISIGGTKTEEIKTIRKLQNREALHLYPPRMEVEVSGVTCDDDLMMELHGI